MSDAPNTRFLDAPRLLSEDEFVERFGGVYEHSPWIAAQTWRLGLDARHDTVEGLHEAMARTLDQATDAQKTALINSHPDLAGRAAVRGELTRASTAEQASAGIDQCTPDEFERFQTLNAAYKARFGFTFIMAVKGSNRFSILDAFEERLENDIGEEFDTAIREIHKIALFRLLDIAGASDTGTDNAEQGGVVRRDRDPFLQWIDLAQPRLGSSVVFATDDFFADKARLISPQEPMWREGEYDENGKWMDGWESRRKRTEGHDYAIVRLGVPGVLRGFDIDTRFFTGNYPPEAAIDACVSADAVPPPDTVWDSVVGRIGLVGDSHHYVAADNTNKDVEYTHVRLHIYPDGGVARLRVYGEIRPDWSQTGDNELIDLVALTNGGKALICNDEHFGSMRNLNAPGNAVNMGDGWETARRREPGNDWVILALGHPGIVRTIHVDTSHFKGNYPDHVVIQAVRTTTSYPPDLANQSIDWPHLLPSVKLGPDRLHEFVSEIEDIGPVSHIRINMYPDGGIARIRLFGVLARDDAPS